MNLLNSILTYDMYKQSVTLEDVIQRTASFFSQLPEVIERSPDGFVRDFCEVR